MRPREGPPRCGDISGHEPGHGEPPLIVGDHIRLGLNPGVLLDLAHPFKVNPHTAYRGRVFGGETPFDGSHRQQLELVFALEPIVPLELLGAMIAGK